MKKKIEKVGRKMTALVIGTICTLGATTVALADATTPTSMLSADTKAVVQDFAADIVPTVMDLIALLVPVGLTLWGIGFAIKKGITFLQRRAKSSL